MNVTRGHNSRTFRIEFLPSTATPPPVGSPIYKLFMRHAPLPFDEHFCILDSMCYLTLADAEANRTTELENFEPQVIKRIIMAFFTGLQTS